ncbi:plasmid mobilization protein [Desulforamulus aeronauticus]|uniref:Ribbon-helix-helix protein, copG family n=1 Tax=Desulforamulus aeronauticus DSM 10349 TaxID=1121421 RepID=A0A1M6SAV7_9FIRM|nr:hypothetical protein [Desulforamulus aeronauticus]SHK41759.1 hypothetical protein SAMN02745123_01770 [Desulforamulus aeronauticus DSM 10349]
MEVKSKRGGKREGAGRKPVKDEDKYKLRTFKCTDEEWLIIKTKAEEQGKSISEYIRWKTLS